MANANSIHSGPNDAAALTEALRALEALPPRTVAAKMRVLFPVIEARVAAGIRHAEILASLKEAGIKISMATYQSTLQRLRKEAREHGNVPGAVQPQPSPTRAPVASEPTDTPEALPADDTTAAPEASAPHHLDPEQRRRQREEKSSRYIKSGNNPLLRGMRDKEKR